MKRAQARAYARLLLAAACALLVMAPFLWLVSMSFKANDAILAWPPQFLFTPTLSHYEGLLASAFPRSFVNSLVTSTTSTLLALLFGVPAAYALSRFPRRKARLWSLVILATRMAPPIAFTIPYFLIYKYSGLLDTRLGLSIIYVTFNLSLVVWLMHSFFESVPRSLEEAAWMDGASHGQAFLRIVLPYAAPGIAATAILCFIYAWNDFFFALILTRTQAITAPVAVVNFMNYEGWEWGKIAAAGTAVMVPVIAFTLVVRKYLVQGMTAGAVKG